MDEDTIDDLLSSIEEKLTLSEYFINILIINHDDNNDNI